MTAASFELVMDKAVALADWTGFLRRAPAELDETRQTGRGPRQSRPFSNGPAPTCSRRRVTGRGQGTTWIEGLCHHPGDGPGHRHDLCPSSWSTRLVSLWTKVPASCLGGPANRGSRVFGSAGSRARCSPPARAIKGSRPSRAIDTGKRHGGRRSRSKAAADIEYGGRPRSASAGTDPPRSACSSWRRAQPDKRILYRCQPTTVGRPELAPTAAISARSEIEPRQPARSRSCPTRPSMMSGAFVNPLIVKGPASTAGALQGPRPGAVRNTSSTTPESGQPLARQLHGLRDAAAPNMIERFVNEARRGRTAVSDQTPLGVKGVGRARHDRRDTGAGQPRSPTRLGPRPGHAPPPPTRFQDCPSPRPRVWALLHG